MASWPEPQAEPLAWRPGLSLVLASASPQRREILGGLGLEFEVDPADVEEIAEGDPGRVALENARLKAREVAGRHDPARTVVLAADTVVAVEGRIVDKPADEHEAAGAVGALAGRGHEVWGAVVVAGPEGQWREGLDRSEVCFRSLSPEEVREYVDTGEWRGRAGGYAIQLGGAGLVEAVEGDLENVVGLSTALVDRLVQGLVPAGGRPGDRYNR